MQSGRNDDRGDRRHQTVDSTVSRYVLAQWGEIKDTRSPIYRPEYPKILTFVLFYMVKMHTNKEFRLVEPKHTLAGSNR